MTTFEFTNVWLANVCTIFFFVFTFFSFQSEKKIQSTDSYPDNTDQDNNTAASYADTIPQKEINF
jgi:hypothetical protein